MIILNEMLLIFFHFFFFHFLVFLFLLFYLAACSMYKEKKHIENVCVFVCVLYEMRITVSNCTVQ